MAAAGHGGRSAGDDRPLIEWVVDQSLLRLGIGDSVNYDGDADLIFSHLYGPIPQQLIGKPAIINLYGNKKAKAEEWVGAELHEVSKWATGLTNTIYAANMPVPLLDLRDLIEDEFEPGRGWFPYELPLRILSALPLDIGATVFDGYMGRGTVGRACESEALAFVGIDIDPERVKIAREYLGC